ncbi:MAG: hypothetical protein JW702_00430 [Clostridiales bacterium]|nr:hypothetical protein [Clostridiales bacterium]
MQSSYRIYKNQNISEDIREKEIPVKDNSQMSEYGFSSNQANSLIRKAKEEANRIKETSKALEDEIVQKALKDAEIIIEEEKKKAYAEGLEIGRDIGFDNGYEDGLVASKKESEIILLEAKSTINDAIEEAQKIIENAVEKIIELSVKIAGEIIKKEIELDDTIIVGIAKAALNEVRNLRHITIKVLPKDKKIIEENLLSFKDICPDAYFTILKDATLKENGCVIETDKKVIDATIDSQLQVVKSILLEVRG